MKPILVGQKVATAYFIIPFQLSPVAIRNSVRKAIPKFCVEKSMR